MIEAREIDVSLCRASPTARALDRQHVLMLAESIKANAGVSALQNGLRQPINVRPLDDGYEVRGGGHRLAAFRHLGLQSIPAFVRSDDDAHAELAEIDENLFHNALTPAERAIAIARRKAIYEALHPETAHGGDRKSSRQVGDLNDPERFTKATADAIGQSERAIQRDAARGAEPGESLLAKVAKTALDRGEELDALMKLPPERRSEVVERARAGEQKVSAKIELQKERRNRRERELGTEIADFPQVRAGVIYVDVSRHFEVRNDETGLGRSPESHYPTLPFDQLAALPLPSIAADHCILIFWSTAASLIDDIEIMAEWGFVTLRPRGPDGRLIRDPEALALHEASGRYRSMQVWDKVRIGLGYWFRDRHEFILIGARGNPAPPAPGRQDESLFAEPKGEHSAKPARVAAMIERLWPNTPKIELFQRGPTRPGWLLWGNQANGGPALARSVSPRPLIVDDDNPIEGDRFGISRNPKA
jgi:ParB/RepB/Spo0J family partition protein